MIWRKRWLVPTPGTPSCSWTLPDQPPESWAEIGVLSNLDILCSQICGVLGEGRRGQEWEHMYILMAVREYMKVRGQCQYECMEVRGQCQYECLEVRGQYLSSLSTLYFWDEMFLNLELIDLAWPQASTCQSSFISISPGYCRCTS